MSSYTFRPAVRQNTPLIIGIGGPTKSGKTYSALRLATGLANGGPVVMLNAEGARGHQYADTFKYLACELTPPFRPTSYTDALDAATKVKPAVVIIDSASHMHDGPGGVLEWHEEILDKMAGRDFDKRQRATFAAWVEPKAAENEFIYRMLLMDCPLILCFRAKEKIKLVTGKPPVDLGWQPIAGERVAFETIFTLMLPPHSKGVPDLEISEMREPFDTIVPKGKPIDEQLGRRLAEWARGKTQPATPGALGETLPGTGDGASPEFTRMMDDGDPRPGLLAAIEAERGKLERRPTEAHWNALCKDRCGTTVLETADATVLDEFLGFLKKMVARDPDALATATAAVKGK